MAFELGVNFVDTAQYYRNYQHVRAGLHGAKKDIVISSKTYAHTKELAVKAVEEARRFLDRDVIDVFMLHEQEGEHTLRGHAPALEYLYDCKAGGIIRAVGISTHHVAGVNAARKAGLDVVHPILNPAGLGVADGTALDMERAVALARRAGVGVFAMKALGGGNLFRQAGECLSYALGRSDSVAVGIRDENELADDVYFFTNNSFPVSRATTSRGTRQLWIAEWCSGCGACVRNCSSGALKVIDGTAVCIHEKCLLCAYCAGRCPGFCIRII